tara:strand:+ start:102 stop:623 length:522 start_codon:yes stop_codon:yes gene_type:complete
MRGNFSKNRGAKTLSGRLRQLRALRNVGTKLAVDKDYLDQVQSDGMDFVSKRRKREAAKLDKEFNKVVKDNIVKPHYLNKNYEAPKEWSDDYENQRDQQQLSIEEAQYINRKAKEQKVHDERTGWSKQVDATKARRYYGNNSHLGAWLPKPEYNDDEWYGNYARLQRSTKPIY